MQNGIPVSLSLTPTLAREGLDTRKRYDKKRLFVISLLAIGIAGCVSMLAKLLVHLIDLFTNLAFFGEVSLAPSSPAHNTYGPWVIVVPVIGGLIVGVMALYGSKAIRGHGIPEAMEQILINQSKIKPSITYLKPLSAAISIGTGGPFGAEGPIIATGGALGSTLGQLIRITPNERKILLAAGATAGMSAIFGSPMAAILLAIELLLFEFSPRSFIPVALACITGAAGHHFLFEPGPVFAMPLTIVAPSNLAVLACSVIGICIGLLSVLTTRLVYLIEDGFEKLPVHWALWPALGGLAVGAVGYFSPNTLGVGYYNISDLLAGSLTWRLALTLCVLKFVSWSISLGSGTSGGTLAPLLTIGGAAGAMAGYLLNWWFPQAGVTVPLAVLVGMSAMFAGASRAFLTSIVFALETTGQANALLPLITACTAAYFVSYFLMDQTIMTEKIARRGIHTPHAYTPDGLEKITVAQVLNDEGTVISDSMAIREAADWITRDAGTQPSYIIISDQAGEYRGLLSVSNLLSRHHRGGEPVGSLVKRDRVFIRIGDTLKTAAETMARENVDVLPVIDEKQKIIGILTYQHILLTYRHGVDDQEKKQAVISLKRKRLKVLVRGQKLLSVLKDKGRA